MDLVLVQIGVEFTPDGVASRNYLNGTIFRVAAENGVADPTELHCFDEDGLRYALAALAANGILGYGVVIPVETVDAHWSSALDVGTNFDSDSVSNGDTKSAFGLKEAVFADADLDVVATGESTHR